MNNCLKAALKLCVLYRCVGCYLKESLCHQVVLVSVFLVENRGGSRAAFGSLPGFIGSFTHIEVWISYKCVLHLSLKRFFDVRGRDGGNTNVPMSLL